MLLRNCVLQSQYPQIWQRNSNSWVWFASPSSSDVLMSSKVSFLCFAHFLILPVSNNYITKCLNYRFVRNYECKYVELYLWTWTMLGTGLRGSADHLSKQQGAQSSVLCSSPSSYLSYLYKSKEIKEKKIRSIWSPTNSTWNIWISVLNERGKRLNLSHSCIQACNPEVQLVAASTIDTYL
jgi:hypothetical protein